MTIGPAGSGTDPGRDLDAATTLEQHLAAGQVEAALILKGNFTDQERELVRRAFDAGYKLGKEHRAAS